MDEEKTQMIQKLFLYPIMLIIIILPLTISVISSLCINNNANNIFSLLALCIYSLHGFCNAIIYGFTIGIKKIIKDYYNYSILSLQPKNKGSIASIRSQSSDSPNLLFDTFHEFS